MIIPEFARYDYCTRKACDFLYEFNIISYPINPYDIISKNKWGLLKYSELAIKFNCTIEDVSVSLGSKDGFTIYDGYNYTIAYNDSPRLGKRIIFTLLHEIGHIYLGHLLDFENTKLYRSSLTKKENLTLERETNAFARNVLAPAIIIKYMKDVSEETISNQFGISRPAAKSRLGLLSFDLSSIQECGILKKMQVIYKNFYYKKTCKICGHFFIIPGALYCPICGEQNLKWEATKDMIYTSYETHNNNKLVKCPICNNEQTEVEGFYCHICGVSLVNYCDDRGIDARAYHSEYPNPDIPCGAEVPPNARYCPKCGNKTTFYNDGVLDDWKKAKMLYIPETEEELPFN